MTTDEYKAWNDRCASLRAALQEIISMLSYEDDSPRKEVEYVMNICAKAIMADNAESEQIREEFDVEDVEDSPLNELNKPLNGLTEVVREIERKMKNGKQD